MTKRDSLKRILSFIGRYKALLLLSSLAALLTVALTLYVPILIGDAIEMAYGMSDYNLTAALSFILMLILVIGLAVVNKYTDDDGGGMFV